MVWRPIDFQSIVGLDQGVVSQLDQYLQEKEGRLAQQIQNSIPSEPTEKFTPSLPTPIGIHYKLSEAVEGLTKKIRRAIANDTQLPKDECKSLVKEINTALWELTDVLEGCVVELFQQINQVNLDKWHRSLSQVVSAIKEILVHRLDDLIWVVRRLEDPLREFQEKCGVKSNYSSGFFLLRSHAIDPGIMIHLNQSEEYLKTHYDAFHKRYKEYVQLSVKVEEQLQKMKNFPQLALLEVEEQNLYIDIFRLLKLLELNPQPKKSLGQDTVKALKNLCSVDGVIHNFQTYLNKIAAAFFNCSLELKSFTPEMESGKEDIENLGIKSKENANELQHLLVTMMQYREFMLQNDPNPYIRSRWGFTDRSVAPEPAKARALRNMIYTAEQLKGWYERFLGSIKEDPLTQQKKEDHAHIEIDRLLHEMSQPLISYQMMRYRAEQLLEHIMKCDELGSNQMSTVYYIQDVLSKALRVDWKYHVLHEFSLFHEIYQLHLGLVERIEEPAHAFRLEMLQNLLEQIERWVEKDDVYSHIHEIEMDMSDLKMYLQDFLATVQRANKDKSKDPFLEDTVTKLKLQLLEYRYLFGKFFSQVISQGLEGQQLRNQFLFVDQYLETVESQLVEMKPQ